MREWCCLWDFNSWIRTKATLHCQILLVCVWHSSSGNDFYFFSVKTLVCSISLPSNTLMVNFWRKNLFLAPERGSKPAGPYSYGMISVRGTLNHTYYFNLEWAYKYLYIIHLGSRYKKSINKASLVIHLWPKVCMLLMLLLCVWFNHNC